MINFSILEPNSKKYEEKVSEPEYFRDLNLDQIIQAIFLTRKEYKLNEYYYRLPVDQSVISYRQDIMKDMEKEKVFEAFLQFSDQMKQVREFLEKIRKSEVQIQKERWQYDALFVYSNAIDMLYQNLSEESLQSDGLQRLLCLLKEKKEQEDYLQFQKAISELNSQLDQMRVLVTLNQDKLKIVTGCMEEDYCNRFEQLFPDTYHSPERMEYVESPFLYQKELSRFEQLGLELYQNQSKDIFGQLKTFVRQYQSFIEPWVLELEQEVQFYLAFLIFEKKYELDQYHFAYPVIQENEEFSIQSGYDLALLMKNSYHNIPVVANDILYKKEERFMVVTGPNQGGKTTFARSIGQIVYFALLGLKAPCQSVRIPMFEGILTHFSVEESMETGRGKLLEELTRLVPMMKSDKKHQFVILNELFTTAASFDACEMGKRVMEHFIHSQCYGIYVTHLQELAKETNRIVSLAALVDEKDQKIRTYKIVREPASGMGYAIGLVEKYQLTYSDIKRRLLSEGITSISE